MIAVETLDGVRVITLDRPERRDAMALLLGNPTLSADAARGLSEITLHAGRPCQRSGERLVAVHGRGSRTTAQRATGN